MLICAAIGVTVELTAYVFGLYRFEPEWLAIVVVVLVFGLMLGGVTYLTRNRGLVVQGLAGAAIGVPIELMNVHVVHLWTFGDLIGGMLPQPTVRAILLGLIGAALPIGVNLLLLQRRSA